MVAELWKENWEESQQRFTDWWSRKGVLMGQFWVPIRGERPHDNAPDPGPPESPEQLWTDPVWRARRNHHSLANSTFPGDTLAVAATSIGPGMLALFLGSEPGFDDITVWYYPCIDDPDSHPPLRFDSESKWWKVTESITRECLALSEGRYHVGIPDLIENYDILDSLRDTETLMLDLMERPEWVKQRLGEVNQAFFEAYDRIYDMVKADDGSVIFQPFGLWGSGKVDGC